MRTTIEFLDALKARNGGASDYRMAQILGVTKSAVSQYRNGKTFFDNSMAIKVSKMLNIDAGFVLACCQAERSRSEAERKEWQGIAALFPKSAKALFVLCKAAFRPIMRPKIFA